MCFAAGFGSNGTQETCLLLFSSVVPAPGARIPVELYPLDYRYV